MKQLIPITYSVLVLSAPAYASDKGGLPDHMLGGWCGAPELAYNEHENAYKPGKEGECPDPPIGKGAAPFIKIEPHRYTTSFTYFWHGKDYTQSSVCLFDKVEHSGSQSWWVHTHCNNYDSYSKKRWVTRYVLLFQGQASDDNRWIGLHIDDVTKSYK